MIPNVHVAPPPAVTVARTTRKCPFHRPGATDVGASYLVPEAIWKKFSEGFWSTHIPLTFLTDRYCAHGSTPKSLKDFYNLDPTSGQIFSIDKPLSTDGEDSLTFDEWFQAWSRLLGLIKEFLKEEYDLRKIHYERILYKENCTEQWTLFLAYDIEIHLHATQKEIDPSIFHIVIWNDLELRLTSGHLATAVEQKLIEKFSSGSSDPVITHHGNAHPKLSSTDQNVIFNTRIQVILLDTIRQGTVTAIAGMGTRDVSKATVALTVFTGACYVAEKPTVPNFATPSEFLPIVTPLIADTWELHLKVA
ncbi:hypothetical protein DXG01_004077, partial [Tephrocybe rancida]